MKKLTAAFIAALICLTAGSAMAQEQATAQEVYEKVQAAAAMLEQLGPEGLAAFNDPKGEFTWKDSYVFIVDCAKGEVVAHPNAKIIGGKLADIKDKPGDIRPPMDLGLTICRAAQNPDGLWIEYYWEKLGSDKPQRKISFCVAVPGQPYIAVAGVYDQTTDIDQLNKSMKLK